MSLEKKQEERRRKVRELILKGHSYSDIADKLNVSVPTISADVKAINETYAKRVLENPDYLDRQLKHVFEVIDEYNLIKKKLYEVIDNDKVKNREKVAALGKLINNLVVKAKLLKLIQPDKTFIQNNYIHIDELNNVLTKISFIIKKYISEDEQLKLFEELKAIEYKNLDN